MLVLSLIVIFLRSHTQTALFDNNVLKKIATQARIQYPDDGSIESLNSTITYIHQQLIKHYGGHIETQPIWISNLAGGFKTAMYLFHGSLSEYVMIWGSSVDTTGHSGRNWAEFHDFIIAGEGRWWKEGGLAVRKESTGAYMYTPMFQGHIVQLTAGTWMLEHCHGVSISDII